MTDFSNFEKKWFDKIQHEVLEEFPDSFIEGKNFDFLPLPGKSLVKGSELFGKYEIIDIDGNSVFSSDKINKIKYILYSNRNCPSKIKMLEDNNDLNYAVTVYEEHLDNIIKIIREDFKSQFPNLNKAEFVINRIFRHLNLHRY